jgi:hypothetical protein
LRLATNQVRDSKNITVQTMRLNSSRACTSEKPRFPSIIKAKELKRTLALYIRIGHPRSSGGLDFSNASSSGVLVPTEEEMTTGWESRLKIAYSPKIQNVLGLPRAGWDEWYIFNTPTDLGTSHLAENIFEVPQDHGHVSVLVNYYFALDPPERSKDFATLFWAQLARIRPESYVADNDYLTFVSTNKTLFASVHDAVRTLGQP